MSNNSLGQTAGARGLQLSLSGLAGQPHVVRDVVSQDVTGQDRIENAYVLNQLHNLLTKEEAAITAASQPVLKMAHTYRVNQFDPEFWIDQVLKLEGIQDLSSHITDILTDFPQFAEQATTRRARYSERVFSAIKTAIRPYQEARMGYQVGKR